MSYFLAFKHNPSPYTFKPAQSLLSHQLTMSPHHVLVIGGHGKIAQLLTPLLLRRSWTVTSLIRAQEQAPAIERLGSGLPGTLNVLVRSIDEVDSQERAASILNEVKPDYVAWSAGEHPYAPRSSSPRGADGITGAGGKGGAEMVPAQTPTSYCSLC